MQYYSSSDLFSDGSVYICYQKSSFFQRTWKKHVLNLGISLDIHKGFLVSILAISADISGLITYWVSQNPYNIADIIRIGCI